MKKLISLSILFSLSFFLFTCQSTSDEKVGFDELEMEYGKIYKKDSYDLFSGLVVDQDDSTGINRQRAIKEGVFEGASVWKNREGDTLLYHIFKNGKNVFEQHHNKEGEIVYTYSQIWEESPTIKSEIAFSETVLGYIKNGKYAKLDSIMTPLVAEFISPDFWENGFDLLEHYYGPLQRVKLLDRKKIVQDTLSKYENKVELIFQKGTHPLVIKVSENTLMGFDFDPIEKNVLKYLDLEFVFENIRKNDIRTLYRRIGIEDEETLLAVQEAFLSLGKLLPGATFKYNYLDVSDGDPVIANDFIIEFEKNGKAVKHILVLVHQKINGEYKLSQFWVKPLRFELPKLTISFPGS